MIPKTVHFTWKTDQLPEPMQALVEGWSIRHPEWQIKLWTDEDNRKLIQQHYPWFLQIFDGYPQNIMRADAVRYFILHHEGGVYADLDVECFQPIDEIINKTRLFLSVEPEEHISTALATCRGLPFMLCNAFMGSEPGHTFWQYTFSILKQQGNCPYVLDATGPFMLTGAGLTADPAIRPDLVLPSAWSPLNSFGNETSESEALKERLGRQFTLLDFDNTPLVSHLWHSSWFKHGKKRPTAWLSELKWNRRRRKYPDLQMNYQPQPLRIEEQRPPVDEKRPSVLIATPMKNAAAFLPRYIQLIEQLDYPKEQIGIAIITSDCTDSTQHDLENLKSKWQNQYRELSIEQQDFGFHPKTERWHESIQMQRRSIIAQCRNRLARHMTQEYDFCFFMDVDLSEMPTDILQRMMGTGHDVVVANCVDEKGEIFDLNNFTYETHPHFKTLYRCGARRGLLQPPRGYPRLYLDDLGYLNLVPLDGVGGTALLIHAGVLQQGVVFPETPYKYHLETEGFGLMARERGFSVVGMPNLKVVHPRH